MCAWEGWEGTIKSVLRVAWGGSGRALKSILQAASERSIKNGMRTLDNPSDDVTWSAGMNFTTILLM